MRATRIGDLSDRTGASPRALRYYEQLGLLSSERESNGYREYDPNAVAIVGTIRALLDIGLPSALVNDVLPCTVGKRTDSACPALLERIGTLRDEVRGRAARYATIDASLTSYLDTKSPTDGFVPEGTVHRRAATFGGSEFPATRPIGSMPD